MAVEYVHEKAWEAVDELVKAIKIKDGLYEALCLLGAARMHSKDLPEKLREELDEILAEGSMRPSTIGMGRFHATLHRMHFKTAQTLASRIFGFYLSVHDCYKSR